ncbi:MAG: hypothetical protein WDZ94_04405 [Patescibacteria group bacterium]
MHLKKQLLAAFERFCTQQQLAVSESERAALKKLCITQALDSILTKHPAEGFQKSLSLQDIETITQQLWNSDVENEVTQLWERTLLSSKNQAS